MRNHGIICIVPLNFHILSEQKRNSTNKIERVIISPKQYDEVQERVDSHVYPSDIGHVPSKIASSFSGFTAEQLDIVFLYSH